MQLVIPIEELGSGSNHSKQRIDRKKEELDVGNRVASDVVERNESGDVLLSSGLREQFETMKSVWRQARRGTEGERISSSTDDTVTQQRRAQVRKDLKRKERETAIETAIQVQNEIEKWQNGIADLETLLAAEEEEESDEEEGENGPPGIREIAFVRRHHNAERENYPRIQFPYLPAAIPTEDETEEAEDIITMSTVSSSRA